MKVRDAIKELQKNYLPGDDIAMSIFDMNDVQSRCDDREIVLTEDEQRKVLDYMREPENSDANYGLNWDTMDTAIDAIAPNAPAADED